jgi:hypothetical protein
VVWAALLEELFCLVMPKLAQNSAYCKDGKCDFSDNPNEKQGPIEFLHEDTVLKGAVGFPVVDNFLA